MIARSALAAVVAGVLLAGCSSSPPLPHSTHKRQTSVRWWTSTDYCGILRDTLRAGNSILPGAGANAPERLTATKRFVASVTSAAPGQVRAQWQVLGPALTQLVESGGKPAAISGVNTRLVSQAATAIAADAKTRCRLDLSS